MNNCQLHLISIILLFPLPSIGQIDRYFPFSPNPLVVEHSFYTLSYSDKHKQAEWLIYLLTKKRLLNSSTKRLNNFRPDPAIPKMSAELVDYKYSGFDRGHLAPAGDMKFSFMAMSESFLLSNISPQHPNFNRGIWLHLEDQVRTWAKTYDSLYIITAGILTDSLSAIGINKVSIPSYFYKIIFRITTIDTSAICFLLPNEPIENRLQDFVISIDSLENLTEIDFFYKLHPLVQERLECCSDTLAWFYHHYYPEQNIHKGNH